MSNGTEGSNTASEVVKEGLATIRGLGNNAVFYNPAQCVNRDLSVSMIQAYVDLRKEEWAQQQDKIKERLLKRESASEPAENVTETATETATETTHNDDEVVDEEGASSSTNTHKPKSNNKSKADSVPKVAAPKSADDPFPGITIFEALSASGLRSVRYFKEIQGVRHVIANDLDPNAVQTIAENVKNNGLTPSQVLAHQGDCNLAMHRLRGEGTYFDVVDLDPYGSAAPFLDAAVQAVSEGGLLCVTCTDMAVLCGNNPEVAYAKYGATPIKASYMHEGAVRVVLQSVAQTAARHKRYIEPLGSFFIDFYLRCFVRVYTSPIAVKNLGCQLSLVYQCVACDTFALQPMQKKTSTNRGAPKFIANHGPAVGQSCPECSSRFTVGGPLWNDYMHNRDVLQRALAIVASRKDVMAQWKRITGLMTVASEELPDVPLFFSVHAVSRTVKTHAMPAANFRSALVNAGYRVSQSHTEPQAVKTDAPAHFVWDMMRLWHSTHKEAKPPKPNTVAERILSRASTSSVHFEINEQAMRSTQGPAGHVPRFMQNPSNWGPKKAAAGGKFVGNKRPREDLRSSSSSNNKATSSSTGPSRPEPADDVPEPDANTCQESNKDIQDANEPTMN